MYFIFPQILLNVTKITQLVGHCHQELQLVYFVNTDSIARRLICSVVLHLYARNGRLTHSFCRLFIIIRFFSSISITLIYEYLLLCVFTCIYVSIYIKGVLPTCPSNCFAILTLESKHFFHRYLPHYDKDT